MAERIDVFISSTSRDLPLHRKEAMDACLRMGMFPVMMEHLPASDADAIRASLEMVDDAEIYLGIFAWRYGYIPAGHDISITEMEYNRAIERGIPRYIFIMHDDHEIKGTDVEKGIGAAKLETFKQKLLTEQVVNFFKSPEDLRGHIIHSLVPHLVNDSNNLHSKYSFVVPVPPASYIAHPYTLLQTKQVIGREKELRLLTEWLESGQGELSSVRVFNVVAIGGMGKSSLIWKWFNDLSSNKNRFFVGQVWWSFYESDASFENLLKRTLAYISKKTINDVSSLSWQECEHQLLYLLDQTPYLLALDGLERAMLAYNRTNISDLDQSVINIEQHDPSADVGEHLRKMIDPRADAFLKKLLSIKASRCIVSTRLFPTTLCSATGAVLPRAFQYKLHGLKGLDALKLWETMGLTGSRDKLLHFFDLFDRHPLFIRTIAGEVAHFRLMPGNFDSWQSAHPEFDAFKLPLVQVRSQILAYAFSNLSETAMTVLNFVAGLRMPAQYNMLYELSIRSNISIDSLDRALSELENRGLLGWDRQANRYDLHPIVKGTYWSYLKEENRRNILNVLNSYLSTLVIKPKKVQSIDELTTGIEIYNTLIGLKKYNVAYRFYRKNLSKNLSVHLHANYEISKLLEMLFSNIESLTPLLDGIKVQGSAINDLALAYQTSGQIRLSSHMFQLAIKLAEEQEEPDIKDITAAYVNLSHVYRLSGDLYKAEIAARKAILTANKTENIIYQGASWLSFGTILALRGLNNNAKFSLRCALELFEKESHIQGIGYTEAKVAQLALKENKPDIALNRIKKSLFFAEKQKVISDNIQALWIQGLIYLQLNKVPTANSVLDKAITLARALNDIEQEVQILIGIAYAKTIQEDFEQAIEYLDSVWEYTERGPYPLFHADALNIYAQIERARGNIDKAVEAAKQAYQKSWCDGHPYSYREGLVVARKHLVELGVPYPEMSPFDSSKYDPMPEIEIYDSRK